MAGYWDCIAKKKEDNNYSAIMTELTWSIKDLLQGQTDNFFVVGPMEIMKGQKRPYLAQSGSQSECRILFILPTHDSDT